jgi:hypothetical protein
MSCGLSSKGSQKTTGPRSRLETKLRPMPYSRAAINPKNEYANADNEFCKGLSFIRFPKNARTLGHNSLCFSCRAGAGGVEVRRLSVFVVAKSPSPCKDHALGRRRDGTARWAAQAKHANGGSLDVDETSNYFRRDGDLRVGRFSCSSARGFSSLQQFRQPGECFSCLHRWRDMGQRGLVESKTRRLRDIGAGGPGCRVLLCLCDGRAWRRMEGQGLHVHPRP